MDSTKYLIRVKGKKKSAHYWDGTDTLCHLWSTGGMNQRKGWRVYDEPGEHPLCTMCINNAKKLEQPAGRP